MSLYYINLSTFILHVFWTYLLLLLLRFFLWIYNTYNIHFQIFWIELLQKWFFMNYKDKEIQLHDRALKVCFSVWTIEVFKKFCRLPLPPGAFSTLWKNEDRFKKTYFESKPVCCYLNYLLMSLSIHTLVIEPATKFLNHSEILYLGFFSLYVSDCMVTIYMYLTKLVLCFWL